jgi:hypothetical protein
MPTILRKDRTPSVPSSKLNADGAKGRVYSRIATLSFTVNCLINHRMKAYLSYDSDSP